MFDRCKVTRSIRRAFSLLELMVAITIMVIVMGTLGALAKAVNEGSLYGETYGTATQHARVATERIAASVREATTSDEFPGMIVVEETVGSWTFPDMLVVWHPEGTAADPDGLPRVNELRVYTFNPDAPNELVEVTFPDDTRTVASPSDTSAWLAEAASMKASGAGVRTVLTNLLRTATTDNNANSERGVVRFEMRYLPSESELASFRSGTTDWEDLAWPQGIYSPSTGMRQAWVQIELQIVPQSTSVEVRSSDKSAVPFLGSASRFFEVHR